MNLASLEGVFELDFTTEPLASAGIFAITGQTGSGKSTILDALCLALFDDTPRLHNATESGVEVTDVKDKTIRQDDCRAILRRGTVEGYAEVDFLSLGGERFRAKWFVNRAHGRMDGSLHNTNITLTNLSTQDEVYGTKKELLARITALVGLTFDQFTRAVLLAQGDFSTFLKAKGKEKAELLEKLTGTEIYSRISSIIFDKTKLAEQEYKSLDQQIKAIELLTVDQVEELLVEQKTIDNTLHILDNQLKIINAKIKWMDEKVVLDKSIAEAEHSLSFAKQTIKTATPRYDYITMIDSVQTIRDTFIQLQATQHQLNENKTGLNEKQLKLQQETELLKQENQKCVELENQLKTIEEAYVQLEPEIRKAQDLDIKTDNAKILANESRKEYDDACQAKNKIEKIIQTLTSTLKTKQETKDKQTQWRLAYLQYQEIIPQSGMLVQSLDFIQAADKNIKDNQRLYEQETALLRSDNERMLKLNAEQERLNRLLPVGIAVLRAALREGEPCPVCGSVHHPSDNKVEESASEEKELDKAKQAVADEIARLCETIERRNGVITKLLTLVQTYRRQQDEKIQDIAACMAVFPAWQNEAVTGALQSKIKQIAQQWNQSEEVIQQAEKDISILLTQCDSEQEKYREATEHLAVKNKKREESELVSAGLQAERAQLLRGNSVEDLKKRYEIKKKDVTEQFKRSKARQEDANKKVAELKGSITQMEHANQQLTNQFTLLTQKKATWMSVQTIAFSDAQLSEMFSKSGQWIEAERKALTDLKTRENTACVTLDERKKNLALHLQSEIKPLDADETKVFLSGKKHETEQQLSEKRNREVSIKVALENNRKNEALRQKYEQTLKVKGSLYENWEKLNVLLGSKDGAKFKKIAQEYTLDFLLTYANRHLHELTQRYELQRIPNTLALQAIDLDMFNEVRTVHSLSGGESFLVSLALALGLSSLSSNRMNVESLFIDEGFGSLDADTLRVAMDALENLQTQGRKIGVISHVAEMTERIATQVSVKKSANGKSCVQVNELNNPINEMG
jgi:exonuclease SbcC